MEEIFNKIIEIDEKSKEIVRAEKDKKKNIDEFIENEFNTKKVLLDIEFKENVEKEKKKYEKMFMSKKEEIDNEVQRQIQETEIDYKNRENDIIRKIVDGVKNEEE